MTEPMLSKLQDGPARRMARRGLPTRGRASAAVCPCKFGTFFPFYRGGHHRDEHEQKIERGTRRTTRGRCGRRDHRPDRRRRGYVVLRRELPLDSRGGWLVRRTPTSRRRTIRGPSVRRVEVRLKCRAQDPR